MAACLRFAVGIDAMPKLKTFGTGKSAFEITPEEVTIFDYKVSSPDSYGVMTHL